MNFHSVYVATIGAGSVGLRAFPTAKQWTENVVLIEDGSYGTPCARVGCMPSKLLSAAHSVRQASEFGIRVDKAEVDGAEGADE